MAHDVFVDTSGFYAILAARDDMHEQAASFLEEARKNRQGFVTTDYVLDETATLLRVRGIGHLAERLFDLVLSSVACRVEWMDAERFEAVRRHFAKHHDHAYSFTDCFSFQTMADFRLTHALTKDEHFREAGFHPLLTAGE